MKEAIINAKMMYKNIVEKAVNDCIKEYMNKLQDDNKEYYEEYTYYVETLTHQQALQATDEKLDISEQQQDRIAATFKMCKKELLKLLKSIDEQCKVDTFISCNNTIIFEIEVDGMEFEVEYKNRYNM